MKIILQLTAFFLIQEATAMKLRRPQEDIKLEFHDNKFSLISSDKNGKTQILKNVPDKPVQLLWELPFYLGGKKAILSPDGEWLILVGHFMLGQHVTTGSFHDQGTNPEYFEIYNRHKKIKSIYHNDIFEKPVKILASAYNIPVKGGGWVGLSQLITNIESLENSIDWQKSIMDLQLVTKKKKAVSLLSK